MARAPYPAVVVGIEVDGDTLGLTLREDYARHYAAASCADRVVEVRGVLAQWRAEEGVDRMAARAVLRGPTGAALAEAAVTADGEVAAVCAADGGAFGR